MLAFVIQPKNKTVLVSNCRQGFKGDVHGEQKDWKQEEEEEEDDDDDSIVVILTHASCFLPLFFCCLLILVALPCAEACAIRALLVVPELVVLCAERAIDD